MATMQEKMAESLAALKAYQDAHGERAILQWYFGDGISLLSQAVKETPLSGMSRIGLLSLLISTASLMVVGVFLQNCLYIIIVERV